MNCYLTKINSVPLYSIVRYIRWALSWHNSVIIELKTTSASKIPSQCAWKNMTHFLEISQLHWHILSFSSSDCMWWDPSPRPCGPARSSPLREALGLWGECLNSATPSHRFSGHPMAATAHYCDASHHVSWTLGFHIPDPACIIETLVSHPARPVRMLTATQII